VKDAPWYLFVVGIALPLVTAAAAFFRWVRERGEQRRAEDRRRREANYRDLLLAAKGFGVGGDAVMRQQFIDQYNLAWLYAPDAVVLGLNEFFEAVEKGRSARGASPDEALAAVVVAARRDLIVGDAVEATELDAAEYRFVVPTTHAR
jgi:hypothetical protein